VFELLDELTDPPEEKKGPELTEKPSGWQGTGREETLSDRQISVRLTRHQEAFSFWYSERYGSSRASLLRVCLDQFIQRSEFNALAGPFTIDAILESPPVIVAQVRMNIDEEKSWTRRAIQLRIQHYSGRQIAEALAAEGFTTESSDPISKWMVYHELKKFRDRITE